jgi:predicted DNA-binding protein
MLKTYLYVPEDLAEKINFIAKSQNKSKAEVIRHALEKGISVVQNQGTASAQALLKIAEIGRKYRLKGPKDLSTHLDVYLWNIK